MGDLFVHFPLIDKRLDFRRNPSHRIPASCLIKGSTCVKPQVVNSAKDSRASRRVVPVPINGHKSWE